MKYLLLVLFLATCGGKQTTTKKHETSQKTITYLALGDSYTKGESVCKTCGFPSQLAETLKASKNIKIDLISIAETGWTTTNLLNAIEKEKPSTKFDLVTLLIGVNNQFQGKPFSLYESEFPKLLNQAITFAHGNTENVIVLSIPDYAFTPYGDGNSNATKISEELDAYNAFAKKISEENNIRFVNVTEITRNGFKDPSLVAKDGLHPSREAYAQFVDILKEIVIKIID